jgi:hypothetical protein
MQARFTEIVRSLRARHIQVLLIGLGSLDLSAVAAAGEVPYQQWKLPPGRYRARDGAHFNAEGYAILVKRTLPQVEALIARVTPDDDAVPDGGAAGKQHRPSIQLRPPS